LFEELQVTGYVRYEDLPLEASDGKHHRFALNDIMKAYDTSGNAAEEKGLKVILTN
jgi:hypothetical protein